MGAFAPSPLVDDALQDAVVREIVRPVLQGMAAEGSPYRGVLYCGLMLTPDGPKVIEFNVRFGDPEAQVVLPMIAEPLAPLLLALLREGYGNRTGNRTRVGLPAPGSRLPELSRRRPRRARVSRRRPELATSSTGLDDVARDCPDVDGVPRRRESSRADLVTAGGRVLTVVATAPSFEIAIARAYEAASKIHFDGMQYRRDIGKKALR